MHVYPAIMCIQCPKLPGKGAKHPGTEATNKVVSCHVGSYPDPLQEQQAFHRAISLTPTVLNPVCPDRMVTQGLLGSLPQTEKLQSKHMQVLEMNSTLLKWH